MKNNRQHLTETYMLAKTWRRVSARIFDIVIVSIIPLITGLIIYYNNNYHQQWWQVLIVGLFNLIIIIVYFLIIPWKFNGQTCGKFFLGIKLVTASHKCLTLKRYFYRELYLIFIPFFLTTFLILFLRLTFNKDSDNINNNDTLNDWWNILFRTVVTFDFAWYCGIMIVVKIDKYHQLFYDRRDEVYVVMKKPITKKIKKAHIDLVYSQPGNISDAELDNIDSL